MMVCHSYVVTVTLLGLSCGCLVSQFTDGLATPSRRGGRSRRKGPSSSSNGEGGGGVGFGSSDGASLLGKSSSSTAATPPSSTTAYNGSPSTPTASTTTTKSSSQNSIYSLPALYDLAFGYRNYEEEVDFLISQHQSLRDGRPPRRVLELAAGPARHCIEALRASYIKAATALDNSPEMVEYGRDVAKNELHDLLLPTSSSGHQQDGDDDIFSYVQADMTDFSFEDDDDDDTNTKADKTFDSAWILLGSLQHLTTNGQVIDCFQCVHRALKPAGTLIIELPHPRETFSMVECTRNGWEVPLEDEEGNTNGELQIVWGDDNDDFDPIRQVRQFTVAMDLKSTNDQGIESTVQSIREVVPLRHFTAQEIDVLARISGFKVTSMHGALCNGVDVNDEDEAFRLVCVLQKKDDAPA